METLRTISKKPPLPPKPRKLKLEAALKQGSKETVQWKIEDENIQQIQRLVAANDKLNSTVTELRKQLHQERGAVRELR